MAATATPTTKKRTTGKKAGTGRKTGAGRQELERRMRDLDRIQREKGYTTGEQRERREGAKKLGETAPTWAQTTADRKSGGQASTRPARDEKAAEIAKAAKDLGGAKFKTPIGATQARAVMKVIGRKDVLEVVNAQMPQMADATIDDLRAFAVKGKKNTDLAAAVREIAGKTKDRLVWGRKCALLLLAIHESR